MIYDGFFDREPVGKINRVPVSRIIEKFDWYEGKGDAEGGTRHLEYWIREANDARDKQGEFSLNNELMGAYRKLGRGDKAVAAAQRTLQLGRELGMEDSEAYATALINAGTVYKAVSRSEEALPLFEKAAEIIKPKIPPTHAKMGGLYNNMALCLADLGQYARAEEAFYKAIDIMLNNKYGELEAAISMLNLASMYEKQYGLERAAEKIEDCLASAEKYLKTSGIPKNGYYAFVCDKCAPVFDYYGWFALADDLKREVKEIHERY